MDCCGGQPDVELQNAGHLLPEWKPHGGVHVPEGRCPPRLQLDRNPGAILRLALRHLGRVRRRTCEQPGEHRCGRGVVSNRKAAQIDAGKDIASCGSGHDDDLRSDDVLDSGRVWMTILYQPAGKAQARQAWASISSSAVIWNERNRA